MPVPDPGHRPHRAAAGRGGHRPRRRHRPGRRHRLQGRPSTASPPSTSTSTAYYVGACAAPTIIEALGPGGTEGAIFNVEGPIDPEIPDPDIVLYIAVVERYGDGLDPVGAGTVSFRSFMNLYAVLRELGRRRHHAGGDHRGPPKPRWTTPSFMGHPYTCDGEQLRRPARALLARSRSSRQIQDGEP